MVQTRRKRLAAGLEARSERQGGRRPRQQAAAAAGGGAWGSLNRDLQQQCLNKLLEEAEGDGLAVVKTWASLLSLSRWWREAALEVRLESHWGGG